ncbi:MAG: CHAP domain-containing protein, partial [Proteobacteria bacterium]|nr:CHAP domain-containing protein [Pseudomonadota bacterium]
MSDSQDKTPEKFGTVLGYAPGDVPAFSSDYSSVDARLLPTRSSFRSYLDGVYLGFKWQCVEFARRWLYVNCGYIFDDVAMAYDIFELRSVRTVGDRKELPLQAFANGSPRRPEYGCMIIWAEGGEFEHTGHVAIAIEVTDDYVRIAEQNVGHQLWPAGCNWSRQIAARVTEDGEYWLECSFGDAEILGWVIQTEDKAYGEELDSVPVELLNLQARELPAREYQTRSWLNIANEDESAYVS